MSQYSYVSKIRSQVFKAMSRRMWQKLASILRYSRWQLSDEDVLIRRRRNSPRNPCAAAPDRRPVWRELQSAGAHLYSVRVTMAALLKVLTAVSRSTAAASLTQTPAVFSPAALRLHGNPQRNCKWTHFDWNWPALSSAWWARWCTRWRWGAEAAERRCGSGDIVPIN